MGIFYFFCNNGTVNTSNDATAGVKLDTTQWVNNWLGMPE
jgi:hypothetical protein